MHRVLLGTGKKNGKKHQNTVYWVDIKLDQKKRVLSNTIECNHPLRHASSLLYPECYHDEFWRSHMRERKCVTSTSSKDFLQRQLNERIGFRSCWRWKRLPTNPTKDQKSNCYNGEDMLRVSSHPVRLLRKSTNVACLVAKVTDKRTG